MHQRTLLFALPPFCLVLSFLFFLQSPAAPSARAWLENISLPSLTDDATLKAGQACLAATGTSVSLLAGNASAGTTLKDGWIRTGRGGDWYGKETRFLRGIPGYCTC